MKKWYILLFSILLLLGFVACGKNSASGTAADSQAADKASYQTITQEKAKELMDTQEVLILDVREQSEYDSGHIPNAVLLPVGQIDEKTAEQVIPAKDAVVLVYCRSGNRSKTAASSLAELGYTQIYEFGGINSWPYEVERQHQSERPSGRFSLRREAPSIEIPQHP